jgi:hypothetical protein
MAKRPRTYDEKMRLDMPFAEALERYVGTKPAEMHANIAKAKQKKPPGGKKHKPSGDAVQAESVISLRDRRSRKRNHGR